MDSEHLLSTFSSELTALVARASVHVVGVAARPHRPASGVALGGDLGVTADHAVERDTDIGVRIDQAEYRATLVGRDRATDIALLRVTGFDAPAPDTASAP